MPKVSVVIPVYNCSKYLSEAINSVLSQTFQDYEIIIVDDGSTDEIKEVVEAYQSRYPNKIIYIYQENKGLAIARNTGIRHSTGEYIALLDADDRYLPERLEENIKIMDQDKNIGLVHSDVIGIKENGLIWDEKKKNKNNLNFLSGYIFKKLLIRRIHICCPTVMIRRDCLNKVGFFDVNLARLGCEDRELWLRISRKFKVGYINKPLACYRHRSNSMSKDIEKMSKARFYVLKKTFSDVRLSFITRRQAYSTVHRELSYCYIMTGEFEKAGEECHKAFSYTPWDLNILKTMLKIYLRKS